MPATTPASELDSTALRRASDAGEDFPYDAGRVTFILIKEGVITQAKTRSQKRAALQQAIGGGLLLAAWPGEWSQDVFVVDDLDAAIAGVG